MKATAAFLLVHLALFTIAACIDQVEPSGDTSACERYASQFGASECATVYQFSRPANTPSGFVELCVPDRYLEEAERTYGLAIVSPRFDVLQKMAELLGFAIDPPCAWQCPSRRGCNAYKGCYCPR